MNIIFSKIRAIHIYFSVLQSNVLLVFISSSYKLIYLFQIGLYDLFSSRHAHQQLLTVAGTLLTSASPDE